MRDPTASGAGRRKVRAHLQQGEEQQEEEDPPLLPPGGGKRPLRRRWRRGNNSWGDGRGAFAVVWGCLLGSSLLLRKAAGLSLCGPPPCLAHEVLPPRVDLGAVVNLVQVTPQECQDHRDGAATAVRRLNADHGGKGIPLGTTTQNSTFVQFSLTSVVAGSLETDREGYAAEHTRLLEELVVEGRAHYIVGTCSPVASLEPPIALERQILLLAQVGPPSFYEEIVPEALAEASENSTTTTDLLNTVFGMHLDSDQYTFPLVRHLSLLGQTTLALPPDEQAPLEMESLAVRIIYRGDDDFYTSTCQAALHQLKSFDSFQEDTIAVTYTPNGDIKGYYEGLADAVCPPAASDATPPVYPAVFVCAPGPEQERFYERWLETGCRPFAVWSTAANNYSWTSNNTKTLPFLQGAAQWHPLSTAQPSNSLITNGDEYFSSAQDFVNYNRQEFGYRGTDADQVVSYSIPILVSKHLQEHYQSDEKPDPLSDFGTVAGKEALRDSLLQLQAETLFGTVRFDPIFQRNVGRLPAATQWLPKERVLPSTIASSSSDEAGYVNAMVFPLLQAQANLEITAPSAGGCEPGSVPDAETRRAEGSILLAGCAACPANTYSRQEEVPSMVGSILTECLPCPEGSFTIDASTGQTFCVAHEDNLLTTAVLGFGLFAVATSWIFAVVCLGWIFKYRKSNVVQVSQIEFLVLICVGAIISSSTLVALSIQAGVDENSSAIVEELGTADSLVVWDSNKAVDAATIGCMAAPFLYCIGWVLLYSSLTVKTLRLYQMKKKEEADKALEEQTHEKPKKARYRKSSSLRQLFSDASQLQRYIPSRQVFKFVLEALLIDMAIMTAFTVVNPLVYERIETGRDLDPETGVLTIETVGRCSREDPNGVSVWAFFGPVAGFHVLLIGVANFLLFRVQYVGAKYQESKWIAIACVFMFEMALVGAPMLVAVYDIPAAVHVVLIACVPLHDIGILGVIFLPKMYYQAQEGARSEVSDDDSAFETLKRSVRQKLKNKMNSRWEQAVGTIDEILDETSQASRVITRKQKGQLETIKQLLLHEVHGETKEGTLMHLPPQLQNLKRGMSTKRMKSTRLRLKGAHNKQQNDTMLFILKEYGGFNAISQRIPSGPEEKSSDFEPDFFDYVLPEFQALSKGNQMGLFRLLSWSSLKRWEFNIFDLMRITEGKNPLLFVGWAIIGSPHAQYAMGQACGVSVGLDELRGYHFADSTLRVQPEKLCDYLRVIEQDYREENPYHNHIHAADVLQTTHTLIQMIHGAVDTSKIDLFSILLAAAVHDVNHPGKNNAFQTNARTDLALMYNDQSILENRHISHAFSVMLGDETTATWRTPTRRPSYINHNRSSALNLLENVQLEQLKTIRKRMIDAILHTDMSMHFAFVNSIKALLMNYAAKGGSSLGEEDGSWKLLRYILHVADISNPAKPDPLFKIWTDRCLEEFFAQGDEELRLGLPISPNCDRRTTKKAESQLGFMTYVVLPAYEVLSTILTPVEDRILPVINRNIQYWKVEIEKAAEEGESTSEQ